jgi:predicted membrane-bound spermidine synthase
VQLFYYLRICRPDSLFFFYHFCLGFNDTYKHRFNFLMRKDFIIGLSVFIAGLCSIVYELLISTTTSYFLGDSIKQFSLTIGIYLFRWVSGVFNPFLRRKTLKYFIEVSICSV